MTTIAWDGKTLAGDRAAWSGSHCYRVRKVYRVRRPDGRIWLVGVAGDGGFAEATLKWMRGGEKPGAYPDKDAKSIVIALVIDNYGRSWKLDSALRMSRCYGRQLAIGGGQECAMGAMLAGASAATALRIVAKCTDLCALGVDVVKF